jgi:hypothetical protein
LFIVKGMISDPSKNNLNPPVGYHWQGSLMLHPALTRRIVDFSGPLRQPQRAKSKLLQHVAKHLITGLAYRDMLTFARTLGDGSRACKGLRHLARLETIHRIPQLTAQRSSQSLFACWQAAKQVRVAVGIKPLLDKLVILTEGPAQHLPLIQKRKHLKLGPARRNRLGPRGRSLELLDQVRYPAWYRVAGSFKELLQVLFTGGGRWVRIWISPQKTPGNLAVKPREPVNHHGIVTGQTRMKLIDQLALKLDQLQSVCSQLPKLPTLFRVSKQRMQALDLGPQDLGQHPGVSPIVFSSTGPKSFPLFFYQLGIQGIDDITPSQQMIQKQSLRGFQSQSHLLRGDLQARQALIQLGIAPETFFDLKVQHFLASWILYLNPRMGGRPINPYVVRKVLRCRIHNLPPLGVHPTSVAVALYRAVAATSYQLSSDVEGRERLSNPGHPGSG